MAALRPSCASEMTNLTPAQTTASQAAQKLDPERFGLAVAGGHAEHLAPAVGVDADGDGDRGGL